jgi:chromosome segregation ATPase
METKITMNKIAIVLLAASVLTACSDSTKNDTVEVDLLRAEVTELKEEAQAKNEFIEQATRTINEIEENLAKIEKGKSEIDVHLEEGKPSQKNKINSMIMGIDAYIANSEQKLDSLEKQSRKSKYQTAGMDKMLVNLRRSLKTRESEIADLKQELGILTTKVTSLETTVTEKETQLEEKDQVIARQLMELDDKERQRIMDISTSLFDIATKEEELADKTKLAPKRRKTYYRSAYNHYQQAADLGNQQAVEKMQALNDKIE